MRKIGDKVLVVGEIAVVDNADGICPYQVRFYVGGSGELWIKSSQIRDYQETDQEKHERIINSVRSKLSEEEINFLGL